MAEITSATDEMNRLMGTMVPADPEGDEVDEISALVRMLERSPSKLTREQIKQLVRAEEMTMHEAEDWAGMHDEY